MSRWVRAGVLIASAVGAFALSACTSAPYSAPVSTVPSPPPVAADPVKACEMLVAAPQGLAQQKATELGCVQTEDGRWTYNGSGGPVQSAAPIERPHPAQQYGGGIWWDEAVAHAGTTQRVCGPLAGSGNSEDDVFLNLGRDYPDRGRFQIVVWDVGRLEPVPSGATLCTSGRITLYNGVAQIELTRPELIEIYK